MAVTDLKTLIKQDLEKQVLPELGIAATYTPKGGSGVAVTLISGPMNAEKVEKNTLNQLKAMEVEIGRDASSGMGGVLDPKIDDTVTIDGVVWKVTSIVEQIPDLTRLELVWEGLMRGGRPDATRRG